MDSSGSDRGSWGIRPIPCRSDCIVCRAHRGEEMRLTAACHGPQLRGGEECGLVCVRLRAAHYAVTNSAFNQRLKAEFGGGGGNRTHVRGTPVAGFSVCSRLNYLAARSVSRQPSSRPARKISITAFGRDDDPARLTSSLSDQRAEPRERRGYLSSQSVIVIGSCNCLHPINERMTLDTLPTTGPVPRRNLDAPRSHR